MIAGCYSLTWQGSQMTGAVEDLQRKMDANTSGSCKVWTGFDARLGLSGKATRSGSTFATTAPFGLVAINACSLTLDLC